MRKAPLRWKKPKPDRSSLYRPAEMIQLWRGDVYFATAQRFSGEKWFWYGLGFNTAHRPDTLQNVKKEATEVAKRESENANL